MSIIERALKKSRSSGRGDEDLGQGTPETGEAQASAAEDTVERAVRRRSEQSASPKTVDVSLPQQAVADAPVPPTASGGTPHTAGEAVEARSRMQSIKPGRLRQRGLMTPDDERSQVAEEFRLIKRPLLTNAFSRNGHGVPRGNVVMITSALPGEGKTFCAINLAISVAKEMDRTVLLVDADVAKPAIPDYLGIDADSGLLDVLRDPDLQLADVLIKTNIEKLTVLPAGRTYSRATELLASQRMSDLVDDLATRYSDRLVIFDSPPLLATSESSVLAGHMGQIVLVVEAERTPQSAVLRGMEQLEGCDTVMTLLNKAVPVPGMEYSHGYYGQYAG